MADQTDLIRRLEVDLAVFGLYHCEILASGVKKMADVPGVERSGPNHAGVCHRASTRLTAASKAARALRRS